MKALRVLQWVLLCVQVSADAASRMSWWAVLLPAWALAGYGLARMLLRVLRMRSQVEEVPFGIAVCALRHACVRARCTAAVWVVLFDMRVASACAVRCGDGVAQQRRRR